MAGGAVVAAAAAAKRQRREHIVDSFRLADATSPDRSRSLAEIGLAQDGDLDELMRAGVICAGRQRSTWYLNEAAFITLRNSRPRKALAIVLAVVLALLAALAGVLSFGAAR
jgi:hypothetical protein